MVSAGCNIVQFSWRVDETWAALDARADLPIFVPEYIGKPVMVIFRRCTTVPTHTVVTAQCAVHIDATTSAPEYSLLITFPIPFLSLTSPSHAKSK